MKFVIVALIAIIAQSAAGFEIRNKRRNSTQNQNNSAGNGAQTVAKNKFSDIFRERDPTKSITKNEFLESSRFSIYNMTRGEAEQIFIFADNNKDNFLNLMEWDKFRTFFIVPFEKCNTNNDYILDLQEFTDCWNKDPKSKLVKLSKANGNPYEQIMNIISTRGTPRINFADYLFIRKTLFAWENCHSSGKYISKDHFACAIKIIIPQQYSLKMSYDTIYDIGIELSNNPSAYNLDYIYYLRICYYTYFFSVFSQPSDGLFLERTSFLKSVREDRLPNKLEENEINIFYELISNVPNKNETKMNFETFAFFYHFHRLFVKHSKSTPRFLTSKELSSLLDDPLLPMKFVSAIDLSSTNFTKKQYSEASLYFQKEKSSEKDFFFGFRQVQANGEEKSANVTKPKNKSKNILQVPKNAASRFYFFKIMSGVSKSLWSKYDYYHTFQLSKLFLKLSRDFRFIVSATTFIEKMQEAYDLVVPIINNNQRANFNLYKLIPKEVYFDLLTFLCLENFNIKVNQMSAKDDDTLIETQLKLVLKEYGMENISDEILDIAKKRYDIMKRRVYDKNEAIKVIIIVHSIAAEQARTKNIITTNKLRKNEKINRSYPVGDRRLTDSYFVGN